MSCLKHLQIADLRNLRKASIDLSPGINLFFGENASGKTSLLEAVALLGLGRSFRTHKTRSLVNHNAHELTVFAQLDGTDQKSTIGIQKDRQGQTLLRINGETVLSAAVLANLLPLQIINADTFKLVEGSPQDRRRFLDWMVFHVKPEFIEAWRRLQRVLKQRNTLLKHDKIGGNELSPWNDEFIHLSQVIHEFREATFADFESAFHEIYKEIDDFVGQINIQYYPGWNLDIGLSEILHQDLTRDRQDGYTHHGPQRADLKITLNKKLAGDILSRGQEKTLVCALHIAQAKLYREVKSRSCVFLVDDLLAELDQGRARQLAKWLHTLQGQIFVTGVSQQDLLDIWPEGTADIGLFHVKQGKIDKLAH